MSTLITSDKTAFIKSFIQNAGSSIVSVEFQKLDGTIRSLQFNPRDTQGGERHWLRSQSA
jgi:hypothetical protein